MTLGFVNLAYPILLHPNEGETSLLIMTAASCITNPALSASFYAQPFHHLGKTVLSQYRNIHDRVKMPKDMEGVELFPSMNSSTSR